MSRRSVKHDAKQQLRRSRAKDLEAPGFTSPTLWNSLSNISAAGSALQCRISYVLVLHLWDELALAVDAGVGALAGDLLLLLGDAARGRRRPARV